MRALLCLLAVLVTSPAFAQQDEIDVSGARVFGSPGDVMRWKRTTTITSVSFNDHGFPTRFDRMDGSNRWPDWTPQGWQGPLQYTLGLCLWAPDGQWECSAVVQMWYGRQDKDPNSTASPWAINTDWFYDCNRWGGSLCSRNPLPGERVGVFVVRGNARVGTEYTPADAHERSNVVLVKWGQDYQASVQPPQVDPPKPPDTPGVPPVIPPVVVPPVTQPSGGVVLDGPELTKRLDEISGQIAEISEKLDREPAWLTRRLTDAKTYLVALSAVLGYYVPKVAK